MLKTLQLIASVLAFLSVAGVFALAKANLAMWSERR